MKTHNKKILKGGYYWEVYPFYDSIPEELPKIKYQTEIFSKSLSHRQILKKYNIVPYETVAEAAAVVLDLIPTLKNDYKSRLVYFKQDAVLYRFDAWRDDDGQLNVDVFKVLLDSKYDAENGVCFSATDTLKLETSSSLETLTLESAIKMIKEAGYVIYKRI